LQEIGTSIRRRPYLLERMFPRFREQFGTALDLIVEFSTLGEYRLAMEPAGAASAPADAPGQAPQLGGASAEALRAAVRRTVAGGATGQVPVATPAARRSMPPATAAARRIREQRRATHTRVPSRSRARGGAPKAPEQPCLAV
jgi:hypothetical protein